MMVYLKGFKEIALILILFFSFHCLSAFGIDDPKIVSAPITHELWHEILKSNVSDNGMVNYMGIKNNNKFITYINLLESNHPNENWSKEEQLSYWINAYNAFTVKLIIDHWPVKSIKDISSPWKKSFINIESETYSLNDIEHEILRKKFKEPRIHFAINCASYSCPVMVPFAFNSKGLEDQLELVTRSFINDHDRNVISSDLIQVSNIFKWFQEDFTRSGSLQSFIQKYTSVKLTNATKIEYLEYNWSLNGQGN